MADVNPKMPLVQFPFSAGIDEGTRDEVVDGGSGWLVLENGRQDKRGGYSTRPGFTALSRAMVDSTNPVDGLKLFADRNTAIRICDNEAHVYDPKSGRWALLEGVPSECSIRLMDLPSMGASAEISDVGYANGYFAVAWLSYVGALRYAYVAIINAATGAVVYAPAQFGTYTGNSPPALVVVGNYFMIVRAGAATSIKASYLNTTSAATIDTGWVTMTDLAADHQTSGSAIAVCSLPHASSARAAVAYANTSGGASCLTVKTFTPTGGVLETQTINTASVLPTKVAIAGVATDTLWVAWNEATLVRLRGLSPLAITAAAPAATGTIITTITAVDNIALLPTTATAAATGRMFVNDTNATMQAAHCSFGIVAATAVFTTPPIALYAMHACGRPFYYLERAYIPVLVADTANLQQQVTIVDWTDFTNTQLRPVANPCPGLGVVSTYKIGQIVAGPDATKLYYGQGIVRSGVANTSALVEMDFANSRRWQTVAWGNSTYVTGGVAQYLDGARVAEVGFLVRPPTPTTATSGTGISAVSGWRYVCVYEDIDADGNWTVSGLSSPSASTGAVSNKTVTVTTRPLTVTSRGRATAQAGSVRVAFYRTLDGGVSPYYRLGTTISDSLAATVTYADTTADATLASAAKLYSQPGIVGTAQDKRPPPGFSMLANYNGMIVGAFGSDIWYSGQNVSGEGAWFNPIFQVPIPGEGDITGLWAQDGTLFVSKRREIYAISGEAPSDNGASGGLGLPRRLSVDVGCVELRSVCTTAFGTIFQSDRGIELLTRAQSVEWIGEAIQTTLAAFPIVTSVTVEPVSSCVLVELASSEGGGLVAGTGRTAVFDLTLRAWVSTDRRTSFTSVADTPSQSACMIYTGSAWRYAWLGNNGRVYVEDVASYVDGDGSFVAKRAICGNVKVAGIQGLQHINRTLLLAKYHTAHDLNLSFAYDYASSFQTVRLYTAAQIATLTSALPNMQIEHPMHNDARCEAVRVQLQDVTPSSGTLGTGQGATWVSLCFEIVPQVGAYKLPNESR